MTMRLWIASVCAGLLALAAIDFFWGWRWIVAVFVGMGCFGVVYRFVWWSDITTRVWDRFASPENIVQVTENGLRQKFATSLKWGAVLWSDVIEIGAEAVDKYTYRENLLIFSQSQGQAVLIGELDAGFKEVLAAINSKFPGMATDWYGRLELGEPGVYLVLWRKVDAPTLEAMTQ